MPVYLLELPQHPVHVNVIRPDLARLFGRGIEEVLARGVIIGVLGPLVKARQHPNSD